MQAISSKPLALKTLTRQASVRSSLKSFKPNSIHNARQQGLATTTDAFSYPLVTLEEHFLSKHIGEPSKLASSIYRQFSRTINDQLLDFGKIRLGCMDQGGITMQVLSHAPADASPKNCVHANNELAENIANNPRYAAFAMLPVSNPPAAAQELERCVKQLGFVGALVDNHTTDGTFFDGDKFLPMFAAAERLDVPLYIHPTFQADSREDYFKGNYDKGCELAIGHWGWGWHANTAEHVLRLFAAGLFDKYPKLKIVLGHLGEMIPFQLERTHASSKRWGGRKRGLQEIWDNNIWITSSGMFSINPMATVLRNTKIERIMYSVDYPFGNIMEGLTFLQNLQKSGMVTEEQLAMIAYKNAENLLKIKVP